MTRDPLAQLREQLVSAADRQAARSADASATSGRRRRVTAWLAGAFVLVGIPAGAVATGIVDVDSGTTPAGGAYTVSTSQDARASGDPQQTDGIGRTCENITFRDASGNAKLFGKTCSPRGAVPSDAVLLAGYEQTPDGYLLVRGTVSDAVARVTVSGTREPLTLRANSEETRQRFSTVTALDEHTVTAYAKDGRILAQTTVQPLP